MNFVGFLKPGSSRSTLHHRQYRRERYLERQEIAQLLLDHVSNHALSLSAEHVERKHLVGIISRALQREQSYLRPVAVRNDKLIFGIYFGERAAAI